jgi:hypothetical protein
MEKPFLADSQRFALFFQVFYDDCVLPAGFSRSSRVYCACRWSLCQGSDRCGKTFASAEHQSQFSRAS